MQEGEKFEEGEEPKKIKEAESFDELYQILDTTKEIDGGADLKETIKNVVTNIRGEFTTDGLDTLDFLNHLKEEFSPIPEGVLRDKVSGLLYEEMEGFNEAMLAIKKKNKKK